MNALVNDDAANTVAVPRSDGGAEDFLPDDPHAAASSAHDAATTANFRELRTQPPSGGH